MARLNILEVFGHSQNTGYLTPGPECSWPELAAAHLDATVANYSSNGLVLCAEGNGFAKYLRPAAALRNRTAAPYLPATDATVLHLGLADLAANYRNNGVYTRGAFRTALRALVAFAKLSSFKAAQPAGASDPSISYGGTWFDLAFGDRNVGAGYRAVFFPAGATFALAVPADFQGDELDIFWLVPGSGNTATWTLATTGATARTDTVTIDNTMADQVTTTKYNVAVTRLTGLNPGAHTITATLTAVTGGMGLLGWGIRATPAPDVYLAQQPRFTQAAYDAWLAAFAGDTPTDAAVDDINRTIADVAATEGATYIPLPDLPLDPNRWTVDAAHPNERGHELLADQVLAAITPRDYLAARRTFTPTYAANWGNDTTPYANVTARRLPPRRVTLSGRAKRTGTPSTGETILTLPEGLWPGASHAFTCPGSTGTPTVTVAADGTVKYTAGSLGAAGTIDLDPIEWTTGQ